MFTVLNRPILPKLVHIEEDIFQLDWSYKENKIKENFISWYESYYQKKFDKPYFEIIPDAYNNWLKSFKFKLSPKYINEIEHECKIGVVEWNRQRGLDTNVREYCLKGSIQHFETAFYLLSDCLIDKEGKWMREYRKLALSVMLYKFWEGQTGRGLIEKNALIEKLDSKLVFEAQFIHGIEENQKLNEKMYYEVITELSEEK